MTLHILSLLLVLTPPQDFSGLQNQLRTDDKIQVIDTDGTTTEGTFESISGASLRLIAGRTRHELPESRIVEIRKQRHESKWDGVLIGMAVGAATGWATIKSHCRGASEHDDCLSVGYAFILPIFAGVGTGSGAVIDFAIKRHDTVFVAPGRSSYRLRFAPILDKQRKGVALAVSF